MIGKGLLYKRLQGNIVELMPELEIHYCPLTLNKIVGMPELSTVVKKLHVSCQSIHSNTRHNIHIIMYTF